MERMRRDRFHFEQVRATIVWSTRMSKIILYTSLTSIREMSRG